jgi:hypothetical protein
MSHHLDNFTVEELQSYFSDFHKDYYGFRPRFATHEEWINRDWLVEQIDAIHNAMDAMKKTPEGRAQLRYEGWQIDESEFV